MVYTMKLQEKYFNLTKNGKKNIEIRLNDDKRSLLSKGDTIIFLKSSDFKEYINVIIDEITLYSSFEQLIANISPNDLDIDKSNKSLLLVDLRKIYSFEDEKKYGVISIRFHIIK